MEVRQKLRRRKATSIYTQGVFFNGGASAVANSYLGGRSISDPLSAPRCQQKGATTTTSSCMRIEEGRFHAARIGREYGGPYPPCVRRRTDVTHSSSERSKRRTFGFVIVVFVFSCAFFYFIFVPTASTSVRPFSIVFQDGVWHRRPSSRMQFSSFSSGLKCRVLLIQCNMYGRQTTKTISSK